MTKPSTSKEDRLSAERVRELFHYDPETGVFTRRVSRQGQHGKVGDIAGGIKPSGYRVIWIGANYMAHRLAWLYVHGTWPDGQLDHINRARDDNRIANLRAVACTENIQNRGRQGNNASGFKGVFRAKGNRRWTAQITANGKQMHLGTFASPEEAHAAYCAAASRLHTHNPAANDSYRSAA
jgi:HNH endonuclease/AP2 domain